MQDENSIQPADVWDPPDSLATVACRFWHPEAWKTVTQWADGDSTLFVPTTAIIGAINEIESRGWKDYQAWLLAGEPTESGEDWAVLSRCVSACAARAFALHCRDGFSEEVKDSLKRAWQVSQTWRNLLSDNGFLPHAPGPNYTVQDDAALATCGLTALVLLHLCRANRAENCLADSLHCLATGMRYLHAARCELFSGLEEGIDCNRGMFSDLWFYEDDLRDDDWNEGNAFRVVLRKCLSWRTLYSEAIGCEEAADVIECVLTASKDANWRQVAEDCQTIGMLWPYCFGYDTVEVGGQSWTFKDYGYHASGRAQQRLSPNDWHELLNKREDDAAEQRLESYFFDGTLWEELPERAQQALIDAERTWFAGKSGRVESVLNDIKVAVESLCHVLIWERLREARGGTSLEEFKQRDKKYTEMGWSPALPDFAWACRIPFFIALVRELPLQETDQLLLIKELPVALEKLGGLRNRADHDPKAVWTRSEITPTYKRFLGIGCEGILPRLAQIKRKIAPSSRRRPALPPG